MPTPTQAILTASVVTTLEGGIVFSSVRLCVCLLSVCLSVNSTAPEPLEISSRNFHGIIPWSKGRTSSTMAEYRDARITGDLESVIYTNNPFSNLGIPLDVK